MGTKCDVTELGDLVAHLAVVSDRCFPFASLSDGPYSRLLLFQLASVLLSIRLAPEACL